MSVTPGDFPIGFPGVSWWEDPPLLLQAWGKHICVNNPEWQAEGRHGSTIRGEYALVVCINTGEGCVLPCTACSCWENIHVCLSGRRIGNTDCSKGQRERLQTLLCALGLESETMWIMREEFGTGCSVSVCVCVRTHSVRGSASPLAHRSPTSQLSQLLSSQGKDTWCTWATMTRRDWCHSVLCERRPLTGISETYGMSGLVVCFVSRAKCMGFSDRIVFPVCVYASE